MADSDDRPTTSGAGEARQVRISGQEDTHLHADWVTSSWRQQPLPPLLSLTSSVTHLTSTWPSHLQWFMSVSFTRSRHWHQLTYNLLTWLSLQFPIRYSHLVINTSSTVLGNIPFGREKSSLSTKGDKMYLRLTDDRSQWYEVTRGGRGAEYLRLSPNHHPLSWGRKQHPQCQVRTTVAISHGLAETEDQSSAVMGGGQSTNKKV